MQKRQIEESDCSILVVSCDRYSDLWTPFFTLFKRFWPHCPMTVYLGTNCAQAEMAGVQTLNAGDDEAWSRRLRFYLEQIHADYVLLMLEDFFLDEPVSSEQVNSQLELLRKLDGVSMRLFPNPPPDYFRTEVGVLHSQAAYRVSLQAAIWNRKRLLTLLVDEESPWAFEIKGSMRGRAWPSGFYCAPRAVVHYQHVVERGEWFRASARRYRAQNVGCDFTARPVMGPLKSWRKKQLNRLRRGFNKLRSRWLCLVYPEQLPDA